MNIIKFKDTLLTKEQLSNFELFNKKFKGKYAYAVNWTYAVSLEDIDNETFTSLSRDIQLITEYDYIILEQVPNDAIDWENTDRANSVISFMVANRYSTDQDITTDELKRFRTWLATYLLAFDQDSSDDGKQQYKLYDDDTTHMLQYYKQEMYDDVIKYLSKFSDQSFTLVSSVSTCGCNSLGTVGGTVVKTLPYSQVQMTSCSCNTGALSGNQSIQGCDPINIYRKNIYLKMVKTFSIIDFWKQFSVDFLKDFKRYVDGIVKLNLPLHTSTFVSAFADCGCLSNAEAEQIKNMSILRDLSNSLQFIIDGKVDGHKNFIQNTLSQWSSLLYENMRW